MSENFDVGKMGELYACNYLQRQGYTVLAQNYRYKAKEIDIIAEHEGYIVFVEVKTRAGYIHEAPERAVDKRKQRYLTEAASYYMEKHNVEKEARFDIIALVKNSKNYKVNHIKAAFMHGV